MSPAIKKIFKELREKYVSEGKTAEWLRGWENGFKKKPTGEYKSKPNRKPAPKKAPKKSKPIIPTDMHAALVEKLADNPNVESATPLKPLPGETPMEYAKRRRKAKGETV